MLTLLLIAGLGLDNNDLTGKGPVNQYSTCLDKTKTIRIGMTQDQVEKTLGEKSSGAFVFGNVVGNVVVTVVVRFYTKSNMIITYSNDRMTDFKKDR